MTASDSQRVRGAERRFPVLELALSRPGSRAASLRRFGEDRLVREAVQVADALPAAVARDTPTVKVLSYDDISLDLGGGRTVAWGSSGVPPRPVRSQLS
ncbi:hypothetical protein SALBM311S_12422 [Streptomyces alboniger]